MKPLGFVSCDNLIHLIIAIKLGKTKKITAILLGITRSSQVLRSKKTQKVLS